jgi:hypothetical protein
MGIEPEAVGGDEVEAIRAALEESPRVDERRISVQIEHGEVVLRGAVATPREASVAALIAEREVPEAINAIQIDPALREGVGEPDPPDPLDDIDRLEPEDTGMTTDLDEALDENEPYEPPDEPFLGGPDHEEPDAEPLPGTVDADEPDLDPITQDERVGPAAADLTAEDLREAAEGGGDLPSLDPDARPEDPADEREAEDDEREAER